MVLGQVFRFVGAALLASIAWSSSAFATGGKVGVMFGSFGDVDRPEEVEPFVKGVLLDPDVAPVPNLLRPIIAWGGWEWDKKAILAEYEAIGWKTGFRANARAQADLVARELQAVGVDAKGYVGLVFTFPNIRDTLKEMQADGLDQLVVFYQGAQYSKPTAQIVFREVKRYLRAHPEWKVKAVAVRSFSDDPRFQDMMGDSIEARIASDFPEVASQDLCIMLPSHGNPDAYTRAGDPGEAQMRRVEAAMKARFPESKVVMGFQNHDEFGGGWSQPGHDDVAKEIGQASCQNVIINGRTSFTIDSLETLYDHAVDERNTILTEDPSKRIVVERMFNADGTFARYVRDLALEAMRGEGDLERLKE